nr:PREDICTED: bifunctional coenzyme A synthase isoform X2 [Latimeria chalumnae]|eukprot:XP_005994082.1 PREDICTED: bifunctional coenzyme A synthase isoform X2 [Latimeria chalumnae]
MSMFRSGLLILTSPVPVLSSRIVPVLNSAAQVVGDTLYVHLHPGLSLSGSAQPKPAYVLATHEVSNIITKLYSKTADMCIPLDVRVLVTNIRNQALNQHPFLSVQKLSHPPDVVLTDYSTSDASQINPVKQCLERYATSCYTCKPNLTSVLLECELNLSEEENRLEESLQGTLESYTDVVVGGTFDRLHEAHKIFLSASCLMTENRLLIGVSDKDLLKNKTLTELIQPYQQRVEKLREFLVDIKPSLSYELVPLADPYGPSIIDPGLKCIVVSEETRKGGNAVNKKRAEKGLPDLALHEIRLIQDCHRSDNEEEKISSSSLRTRLLGTVLIPPKKNLKISPLPYVIGLTGGSGSGKSSVSKRLENLGAALIDSDKLGHETYRPGGPAYQKVIQEFGTGKIVCVVDAAVLLEAGWTDMVHEVWITIIPEQEAITRIMNRDGVSEESARRRLANQWTNSQRLEHANVVLCTLWEPEVTQRQVEKAWNLLQKRISQN